MLTNKAPSNKTSTILIASPIMQTSHTPFQICCTFLISSSSSLWSFHPIRALHLAVYIAQKGVRSSIDHYALCMTASAPISLLNGENSQGCVFSYWDMSASVWEAYSIKRFITKSPFNWPQGYVFVYFFFSTRIRIFLDLH